ncbi:MAG: uracil-DNA glycosylase [Clostridia bacterium]|jgi:DNA polymerase|nr:uracil-DNA glycosylase [Clostridia bacterium]
MTTWEELYETCSKCEKCELHKTRTNCVFGTGNRDADVLFVGEAPGEKEDLSGVPFVGAAGKLLDKYLYAVGIDRERVYIANILKCRPPKNRDPKPEEEAACIDYLREQVRLLNPKVIICLGRISAMKLIKPDFKITQEHGKWFKKGNYLMTAVYHPAALLRDPRKKEDMMADMEKIKEKLEELSV